MEGECGSARGGRQMEEMLALDFEEELNVSRQRYMERDKGAGP